MADYRWDPLWSDVVEEGNPDYTERVRRMIMASINWLADHPQAVPEWREPNRAELARRAGVPADAPVTIIGDWEDVFLPQNAHARHWFRAIAAASGTGRDTPTAYMMGKAVYCGLLFKRQGWEAFNSFMLEHHDPDQRGH